MRSKAASLTHTQTHTHIHSLTHSLTHARTNTFSHTITHSFTHSLTHSFTGSFSLFLSFCVPLNDCLPVSFHVSIPPYLLLPFPPNPLFPKAVSHRNTSTHTMLRLVRSMTTITNPHSAPSGKDGRLLRVDERKKVFIYGR